MQQISIRRIAPILGLLGAMGPLAIDMYLPAMPQIAADLNIGEGEVQFSLMAFFAGLMIAQLFYGPLSDRTGRKPMIYTGLLVFTVASIGCALASSAGQLIAWRFIQGLGGSIGIVIGLAVVRDLFTGKQAASLVALIMLVSGASPILAPLVGTSIMAFAPWPAIFVAQALFGTACMICVFKALPETRLEELRRVSNPLAAARNYAHLLVSRRYIPYVAVSSFAMAGFFSYLAASSFVFISLYGLTPTAYSIIFAVNAIGLMAGTQVSPRLIGRFQPQTIIRAALVVYVVAAVLLCTLELVGGGIGLLPLSALLFVIITALAFVMPLNGMMALESYGAISGTAAALLAALQFGAGALASLIVGVLANGTALPMIGTITMCGILGCLIAFFALPKPKPVQENKRAY